MSSEEHTQGAHGNYWRPTNEETHLEKRGIAFDRADEAIADPQSRVDPDVLHSQSENRQTIIGLSQGQVLRVTVTSDPEIQDGWVIVSVREASKKQVKYYYEGSTPASVDMGMSLGKLRRDASTIECKKKDAEKRERRNNKKRKLSKPDNEPT